MLTKKAVLLVCLATTALLTAIPASASAFEFADKGVPITAPKIITIGGNTSFVFENLGGGVLCSSSAEVNLEVKGVGKLKTYELNPKVCSTTGGLAMMGCTVKTLTAGNLPWAIAITGTTAIKLSASNIVFEFGFEACPMLVKNTKLEMGSITVATDTDSEWTSWTLTGKGTTKEEAVGNAQITPTLSVTPASTYGIK